MIYSQVLHHILYFPYKNIPENFGANFNNSENNIISVELAEVLQY
jgi:hypothetical protein